MKLLTFMQSASVTGAGAAAYHLLRKGVDSYNLTYGNQSNMGISIHMLVNAETHDVVGAVFGTSVAEVEANHQCLTDTMNVPELFIRAGLAAQKYSRNEDLTLAELASIREAADYFRTMEDLVNTM